MIVIATAGHVDHGKSALIRRLTGIEPDRWAEEQRRGLTIDLGFAWATTPQGREIGFVDVPGHERFIANMLAGVGSVPAVLLVIDANEGWRAQTHEHVAILDLLEVRNAVVALTKIDRVASVDALRDETIQRLSSTTLDGARVVAVSAQTDEGIDGLWDALDDMCARAPADATGCARMWVDRAFTVPGAGTVVTGTLTDGSLEAGTTVRILPSETDARVRALHRHGEAAPRIEPVTRAAVNLAGIEPDEIPRGTLITSDPAARTTTMFDVDLRVAPSHLDPFTGRGDHRIHVGTAEVAARLTLIDAPIRGGESVLARVHTAQPLPVRAFDRFIVRDTGRGEIVGGGRVLDPVPPVDIRFLDRSDVLKRLRTARDRVTLAAALLEDRAVMPSRELAGLIGSHLLDLLGIRFEDHHLDTGYAADAAARLCAALATFHVDAPLEPGMPIADARTLVTLPERAMRAFIGSLDGIVDDGSTVRLATFAPALERTDPVRDAIRGLGMQPLDRRDLEARYGASEIAALVRNGSVIALSDKILLEASVHAHAVEVVLRALEDGPQPTTVLRELLGTSRRVALPFLEALDLAGITRFDGTERRRGPNAPVVKAPAAS